ncbi:MAG TPA: nitroreductase family protein [Candidatus Aminicenantes bacterium]|nr:nitroreductase family protein [Candidatus Aminicenantes bacterium]HRY66021.1 nitroreductase family protein [Candidatus Aminicenantes bacterium]HRZ72930.1 nitroreductase family protein [Candidatus Aminicenantes bacterium]
MLPLAVLLLVPALTWGRAQDLQTIKLNEPNKTRGLPVMEALSVRASARDWTDKDLSLQDLSDLLWAANGVNRPDGRKTAPSAMNAQDVDIYVFLKDGVYLYDAAALALVPVLAGDHRSEIMMMRPGGPGGPGPKPGDKPGEKPEARPQAPPPGAKPGPGGPGGPPTQAPVQLILVSDISRFRMGETSLKLEWAALDTGIVSQNISLFCAATGLGTRPRAAIAKPRIKELLKLSETQYPLLNHPVGYKR